MPHNLTNGAIVSAHDAALSPPPAGPGDMSSAARLLRSEGAVVRGPERARRVIPIGQTRPRARQGTFMPALCCKGSCGLRRSGLGDGRWTMLALPRRQGNVAARAGVRMTAFVAMRLVEMHVGWRIPERLGRWRLWTTLAPVRGQRLASRRLPSPFGLLLGASGRSHSRAWIVVLTTTAGLLPVRT